MRSPEVYLKIFDKSKRQIEQSMGIASMARAHLSTRKGHFERKTSLEQIRFRYFGPDFDQV